MADGSVHEDRAQSHAGPSIRIGDINDVLRKKWTGIELLDQLIRIDHELLEGMTDYQEGNSSQWAPVFMDHPDTWRLLLNDEADIVGYWHFVPLFPDFFAQVKDGLFFDSMITSDHVPHMELPGWYDIYFVVTTILPAYRGATATKALFTSLERVIEQFAEQGTFIRNICANAYTPAGISLCRTLGLKFLKQHSERGEVYFENFDTVLKNSVFRRNRSLLDMYQKAWREDEDSETSAVPYSLIQMVGSSIPARQPGRRPPPLILTGSDTTERDLSDGFEQWFEEIPFPLASIARAWLVEPGHDFKTKYEHLLHFFEATAQFVSVILLSAFSSDASAFAQHKQKLITEMAANNLSFQRSTFGTWKLIIEYLGKQTRQILAASNDAKGMCDEMFCDPSLRLPQALSNKDLTATLVTTNKMRNDWTGHGGVVSQEEAKRRNSLLLAEVQKLRRVFADCWQLNKLICSTTSRLRRGVFENEVTVLMGSNSEFLRQSKMMSIALEVERLYVSSSESTKALKLLPLIQVGPSPHSVKNACYFFNRIERDGGARFISYHYLDKPELMGDFEQATDAIRVLTDL